MEFIPSYIRRKHGEEEIIYMLPELKEILLQHYDQSVVDEEARKLTEDLAPIL
jgi:DNA polymerase-3 subunit alpha